MAFKILVFKSIFGSILARLSFCQSLLFVLTDLLISFILTHMFPLPPFLFDTNDLEVFYSS